MTSNPTNTQEDELLPDVAEIVKGYHCEACRFHDGSMRSPAQRLLKLISTQREQARQELLDELENLTRGTVCLYHHAQGERGTGYDCGCTTEIDREALDSFIQSKRATLKGDSDGNI